MDAFYLLLGALFFAGSVALVCACERMGKPK